MSVPRSSLGHLHHADGRVERARLYQGADEPAARRMVIDPAIYSTWIEDDGSIGIRRGTSVSVGAARAYSANYDAIDWGN